MPSRPKGGGRRIKIDDSDVEPHGKYSENRYPQATVWTTAATTLCTSTGSGAR